MQASLARDREAELELLSELVDVSEPLRAVVLSAAPGMGKSRLWAEGVTRGRRAAMRVLATTCAEAEAAMPYAGLMDLLSELFDSHEDVLPVPQRHALEQVLLRAEHSPNWTEHGARTVAAGVLTLLRRAVATARVLLAIDNLQWLDAETERALTFAARRLQDQPLNLLVTEREELTVPPSEPAGVRPSPLPEVFEQRRIRRLGPMAAPAAQAMLADRTGLRVPLEVVRELVSRTGGNPFWLLEFVRAGYDPTNTRIPMALPALIGGRLPDRDLLTERAAALVAALGRPRVTTVLAALTEPPVVPPEQVERALDTAIEAGLVMISGDRLQATHPLVGAAVLAALPSFRRSSLYRQAADWATTPEQSAHHLVQAHALSVPAGEQDSGGPAGEPGSGAGGPSWGSVGHLVDALDQASAFAQRRGALVSATGHAERALAIAIASPDAGSAELAARMVATSELHLSIGGYSRARDLARQVDLAALPDDQLFRVATVLIDTGLRLPGPGAAAVLSALESEPRYESALPPAAITTLRASPFISGRDWIGLAERGAAGTCVATAPEVRRRALGRLLTARLFAGRHAPDSCAVRLLSEMEALDKVAPPAAAPCSSAMLRALYLFYRDRIGDAHASFVMLEQRYSETGDDVGLALASYHAAYADFFTGDLEAAERRLDRIVGQAGLAGLSTPELDGLSSLRAMVYLARGDPDRVGRMLAQPSTVPIPAEDHVRGLLAIHHSDWPAAVKLLESYLASTRDLGIADPYLRHQVDLDLAEACLRVGRVAQAEQIAAHLDDIAHRSGRAVSRGQERRLRAEIALLCDPRRALVPAREAVEQHSLGSRPAELARSAAVLAEVHRLLGDEAGRRQAVRTAAEAYREAGHRSMVLVVGRSGVPGPDIGVIGRLTSAERSVAEAVMAGNTNREAAQALRLSVRTVENHLSRIYRKLNIGSRSQLRSNIGGDGNPD